MGKRLFLILVTLSLSFGADLSNIKQLTNGGENAEAYWSPDGKRLIFQSTRGDLKCDQIFIMNADGSDQHMVPPARDGPLAATSCPTTNTSFTPLPTSLATPALPPPTAAKATSGPFITPTTSFRANDDGTDLKRLTETDGYDAEATVNWKTKTILYTSMASGDLDLWTMKLDGSNKKRLTTTYGYDGGAVFSRDGKHIVWRGNHPDTEATKQKYASLLKDNLTSPMKMELFISDAHGKNVKQLTNFNCASFAPTFTPDGTQILFSSNKHNCDGRKFELYLINIDGTGLRQVTDYGGFTSFPEFSPDGSKLVFVSDWKAPARYEFNVFTADWGK